MFHSLRNMILRSSFILDLQSHVTSQRILLSWTKMSHFVNILFTCLVFVAWETDFLFMWFIFAAMNKERKLFSSPDWCYLSHSFIFKAHLTLFLIVYGKTNKLFCELPIRATLSLHLSLPKAIDPSEIGILLDWATLPTCWGQEVGMDSQVVINHPISWTHDLVNPWFLKVMVCYQIHFWKQLLLAYSLCDWRNQIAEIRWVTRIGTLFS